MGGTCAAQCLEGLWGPNCMTKCNCSSAEIVCSRFNGACQNVQSEETSAPASGSNTVAIVVPIVIVLVLIGVVVVFVIVRSTKKIEKKMPAGMYTADEQDISYAPSEGGSATSHGISNPTYADPHAGRVNE
ncbi:multiple epidermal growth factor-like domains protein 10 [Sycon ciliatum]|uniref:multiple epidermal growth factor-like domains protein 10 n=1 Tax=Sycon ciliatum TaxID=27933 RepID=UPI0031F6CAB9